MDTKLNSSKIGCSKTLIIQWFGAQKGATAWITHTFPTSFSSTNYYVSINPYEASGKGANNSDSVTYRGVYSTWIKADTKTTAGFCSSGIHAKDIIAIGF